MKKFFLPVLLAATFIPAQVHAADAASSFQGVFDMLNGLAPDSVKNLYHVATSVDAQALERIAELPAEVVEALKTLSAEEITALKALVKVPEVNGSTFMERAKGLVPSEHLGHLTAFLTTKKGMAVSAFAAIVLYALYNLDLEEDDLEEVAKSVDSEDETDEGADTSFDELDESVA